MHDDPEGHEHDDSLADEELSTGQDVSSLGVAPGAGDATLDAYDLDDDGKVSIVEGARAQLGVLDARLDELGDRPGIVGKLAEAAHHVVDRLDNDDPEVDAGVDAAVDREDAAGGGDATNG